jgi:hypothetical protein
MKADSVKSDYLYVKFCNVPLFFFSCWRLIFGILQVTVPSMASVFNEYAMKSQYDTSIYLQVICHG